MSQFSEFVASLGEIDARQVGAIIAATTDIAVIVGEKGDVIDLAVDDDNPVGATGKIWRGRPWIDTVTRESRTKIEELERDASSGVVTTWRQVNHPIPGASDIPVLYRALRLEESGKVIWLGRDLRAVSAIQQQLVASQRKLEQEYARQRHIETRYRLLFQTTSDPMLTVDATSLSVIEMNEAGERALGCKASRCVGRAATELFNRVSVEKLHSALNSARGNSAGSDFTLTSKGNGKEIQISCRYLHVDPAPVFLLRVLGAKDAATSAPNREDVFRDIAALVPDGIVATSLDGRILYANAAFLELAQISESEKARGQLIENWLGQPGIDLNVMISNLRDYGKIQHFLTHIRGEFGVSTKVEIAAVWIPHGSQPYVGFVVRNVDRRLSVSQSQPQDPMGSLKKIRDLIGQASLKEIVRETADEIERLCIEAALELTGDNRASAAELLGLSRQGFYVKLRRYGIGDRDT